jgi:hypothetical protein
MVTVTMSEVCRQVACTSSMGGRSHANGCLLMVRVLKSKGRVSASCSAPAAPSTSRSCGSAAGGTELKPKRLEGNTKASITCCTGTLLQKGQEELRRCARAEVATM